MENLLNSRFGVNLASFLGRATPPWLGRRVARLAAHWISRRSDSDLVSAVRSNQWVAAGEHDSKEDLDQAVRQVFLNSALSIYELYHFLENPQKTAELFVIEPSLLEIENRTEFGKSGLIFAGFHNNGFDLALQWVCRYWIKPIVLTIPNPSGGRQLEFEIRKKTGMNLMPASITVFRQAIRYLQQGGIVITGIDLPVPDPEVRPRFFGRPACLPVHHAFLALKAQVPVMVVSCHKAEDGKYHIFGSPPIQMDYIPDREEELLYNGEKILAVAESFIRQSPQQWVMSHPVWPETLKLLPQ